MIIGIHGKKGSGKDTVAKILSEFYQTKQGVASVVVLHFADTLKSLCSALYGVPLNQFYDLDMKDAVSDEVVRLEIKDVVTPRDLLCYVDDPIKAVLGADVFQVALKNTVEATKRATKGKVVFIIPDVRWDYEALWVKQSGILVEILRPDTDYLAGDDESEAGISQKATYALLNNGSLSDLYQSTHLMLKNLTII